MKFITDLKELEGKTITRAVIVDDAALALAFTDGSFSYIEASSSYDSIDMSFSRERDITNSDKVAAGIISSDEYEAIRQDEEERRQARIEASDLAKYNELKARFEVAS